MMGSDDINFFTPFGANTPALWGSATSAIKNFLLLALGSFLDFIWSNLNLRANGLYLGSCLGCVILRSIGFGLNPLGALTGDLPGLELGEGPKLGDIDGVILGVLLGDLDGLLTGDFEGLFDGEPLGDLELNNEGYLMLFDGEYPVDCILNFEVVLPGIDSNTLDSDKILGLFETD